MVNSYGASPVIPSRVDVAKSPAVNGSDIGWYDGKSVQVEQSYYVQRCNVTTWIPDEDVTVNHPKPRYRKIDLFKDALWSRVSEYFAATNKVISKSAEFIDQYCPFMGQSPANRYCQQKRISVRDSGRKIKIIGCPTEGDNHWLKNTVIGRQYFPGMLIYSTTNETFNANNKIVVKGQTPKCGDLAVLYAKGLYNPGKKGFAQCESPADLADLMSKLDIDTWSWLQNRTDKPKETHAFHANDFSIALKTLVHRHWEMPCGEKMVFILHTEQTKDYETHAMVITLEKKIAGVMVLRHYDPNWTNSCQKIILNHPDHAAYLELQDLYRPKDYQYFFQNGVAKLSSLATTEDSHEADFYWYSHQGQLSAENGLWYERRRLTGIGEQPEKGIAEQIQCLENNIAGLVTEVVSTSDKTVGEKEAILEFFLREIDSVSLRENILAMIAKSDFSVGFKLRQLKDNPFINFQDIFSSYPPDHEALATLSSRELAIAFNLAVKHKNFSSAERIVQAVLSDGCRTEEDKMVVFNHYFFDRTPGDSEFSNKVCSLIIRSNLSLAYKLLFFADCFHDYRHDFENHAKVISELISQGGSLPEPAAGLKLAIYLNDAKLANDVMDAILNDADRSEEEKITMLRLDSSSHVGNKLVARNIEVFSLYLAKIMTSDLSDSQKTELLCQFNGTDRRVICWILDARNIDMALLFVRYVADSTLSLADKHNILSPEIIHYVLDCCYGGSHNEQLEEIKETVSQLIAEQSESDLVQPRQQNTRRS